MIEVDDNVFKCGRHDLKPLNIMFSNQVFLEIVDLLHQYPTYEWLGFLKGRLNRDNILYLDNLTIPPQTVTGGSATLQEGYQLPTRANGEYLGVIHSHNNLGAFHSATDKEYMHNYQFSITVDNSLKFVAVIETALPCGGKTMLDCEVLLTNKVVTKEYPITVDKFKSEVNHSQWQYVPKEKADDFPASKNKYIKIPLDSGGVQYVPVKDYIKQQQVKIHSPNCQCKRCRRNRNYRPLL